ncbi:hypothetical protein XELAEV_18014636mg [Xenopus laevis]|uniref:Guanylyl cyclase-activating protein 2 n=1 Tax=Xenopus laevis TaxID=8355 RepID=A0A974HV52_XENLA|nr:hypothetical protein XELAEV_18014636mg [Xenopus laevis]
MGQHLSKELCKVEIDVAELQEWYKKFVVECPNNQEAVDYVKHMFRSFDKNRDNTIDFLEYVAALNLVLRGKLEHKLKWTFKTRELLEIVEPIYNLKKACRQGQDERTPLLSPEDIVERIFQLVDENGDGQLSLDEFIDGACKDTWVMKMLQMDVSPGSWITEQRRKSALF